MVPSQEVPGGMDLVRERGSTGYLLRGYFNDSETVHFQVKVFVFSDSL